MRSPQVGLLHLHQRVAPLDGREALALAAERADPGGDLLLLTTCHRIELYAAIPLGADPRAHFTTRLGDAAVVAQAQLLLDGDAVRHLFRVACGLDSALRGEAQIHGQIRRTYEAARTQFGLDPLLSDLFQSALRVARELRATTPLGAVRRSVGSLAVEEALLALQAPERATALIVGAGEVGKLAARALRRRVGHLLIANRDRARAQAVATDIGAEAVGLDDLDAAVSRADLVISAADTRGTLLTAARLSPRLARGPLVLVDIAVPRSVAAEARALPRLVYRSVDDLASAEDPQLDAAIVEAERRCAEEANAFLERRRGRLAAATIRALRERAERDRQRQLQRALAKLKHLPERDRRVVEALASAVTHSLLHAPTVALRRAPEKAAAAEELFGLDGDR